jgi:outer membrane protein TolC
VLTGELPADFPRKLAECHVTPRVAGTIPVGDGAALLRRRPDIRQAERELAAAGLDVKVARANFLPRLGLAGPLGPGGPYSPVGWQAFNPRYLFFTPEAFMASFAGDLIAPVINKRAIQAEYQNANARQLQSVYNYQRVIINAANEVITRAAKVENYRHSRCNRSSRRSQPLRIFTSFPASSCRSTTWTS